MKKECCGKVSSDIPKGGGGFGLSSKQSSGKTKHNRMKVAEKVEGSSPKGMPTIH
jgi:hypothetical protein